MKFRKNVLIIAVLALITVCCLAFIFSNSLKDSSESTDQTMVVKDILANVVRFFGMDGDINVKRLRNFAHVAEFCLLGSCLTAIALYTSYKTGRMTVIRCAVFVCASVILGLVIAVIDELLQKFSAGRACELKDVGLDGIGIVLGTLVALVAYLAVYKIRLHIKNNEKGEKG